MSNIVDQAFDKWLSIKYPSVQEFLNTAGDPDAWYRHSDLLRETWRAAVEAFSWKETVKDGLPAEIGNYIVVLQNNHIIHAQYLRVDPEDESSPCVWCAPVYGELDQEEPDFEMKYFMPVGFGDEMLFRPISKSEAEEKPEETCSFYYVDGPIKGCKTVMVNPPKKKPRGWPEAARQKVNDMAMELTRIVWWRRLELPGYEGYET